MFRPGSGRGNYHSSESESDWDTTEVPSIRHSGASGSAPAVPPREFQDPPTPRTRASLTEKEDVTGDGTPSSLKGEETQPPLSAMRDGGKLRASTSNLSLSVGEPGSRNPSPIPPYMAGFRDAIRNGEDISRGEPSSPSRKRDTKSGRYEPSPSPSPSPRHRVPVDAEAIPDWDDSDADEQTLREVHTTFKKEKTREIETESARREFQDEGKPHPTTRHGSSVLEKWMQAREEKKELKNAQGSSKTGKTGLSSLPTQWSKGGDLAIPEEVKTPYHSFVVKDQEGRRFLYLFNEGNTAFYEVEEEEDAAFMSTVADKVEPIIRRVWREFFAILRIIISVVIFLLIEATHFLTNYVAHPLFLALVITVGDHFLKPILAGLFNLVLQPLLIFMWNVLSGTRNALQPLVDLVGAIMTKGAILLQAFRLVEVNSQRHSNDAGALRVVGFGRGARSESDVV